MTQKRAFSIAGFAFMPDDKEAERWTCQVGRGVIVISRRRPKAQKNPNAAPRYGIALIPTGSETPEPRMEGRNAVHFNYPETAAGVALQHWAKD